MGKKNLNIAYSTFKFLITPGMMVLLNVMHLLPTTQHYIKYLKFVQP